MQIDDLAWDDLRLLLALHRFGSFLAVGRALGVSTSTVARRVDALEATAGRALVLRSSHGATLEEDALPLVRAAESFERALATVGREGASPYAGVVRVSAPDGFGPAMALVAARFRARHPETQVEVAIEQRFVDLAAREADLGVRAGRSRSTVLVERALGEVRVGLYAAESYLAQHLPRRTLARGDFASQAFVGFERTSPYGAWLAARGATNQPFRSDSLAARVRAAEEGTGIVELALGTAAEHPRLARIATEEPLPSIGFFLTTHRALRRVPRVRGVADEIVRAFGEYHAAQAREEARPVGPRGRGPGARRAGR